MWPNVSQQSFALQQSKIMYAICMILSVVYTEVFSQLIVNPLPQTCTCVPINTCYQNLQSDGTGQIDIRIINNGAAVTLPPIGPTITPPGVVNCLPGQENCCSGPGVTGCGLRWNIPQTPTITPALGQAKYGSHPWAAVVLGIDNAYLGGGVLIDSVNVLTTAHKVANRTAATIKVRLGEWDSSKVVEPYPTQEALVIQIRLNPGFNAQNLVGDVAILRLATPIQVGPTPNPTINTACAPGAAIVYDNMRCMVSGWGRDNFVGAVDATVIKEVEVPIMPNSVCEDRLRTTKLGPTFTLNTAAFICAGGEQGKDACTGDGGSALVCSIGGRYQVVGLVAWGIGCASANIPGVYVRVQNYWPWIQQNQI